MGDGAGRFGYWTVVNERNDIVHGNVNPVRDSLEVVYFNARTPIFPKGGDPVEEYFQSLLRQYEPEKVLKNHALAHSLIAEILGHMVEPTRLSILSLMNDTQPGWDDSRGKFGMLFRLRWFILSAWY